MAITRLSELSEGLYKRCEATLEKRHARMLKKLLKEAFKQHPDAVAIASNQVLPNTTNEAPAAFYYDGKLFIDPSYVGIGHIYRAYELCLSDPGNEHLVDRFENIVVAYTDVDGNIHHHVLDGFDAQVFQHETDHLNGHTIWQNRALKLQL